jgi:hypothetical protein
VDPYAERDYEAPPPLDDPKDIEKCLKLVQKIRLQVERRQHEQAFHLPPKPTEGVMLDDTKQLQAVPQELHDIVRALPETMTVHTTLLPLCLSKTRSFTENSLVFFLHRMGGSLMILSQIGKEGWKRRQGFSIANTIAGTLPDHDLEPYLHKDILYCWKYRMQLNVQKEYGVDVFVVSDPTSPSKLRVVHYSFYCMRWLNDPRLRLIK